MERSFFENSIRKFWTSYFGISLLLDGTNPSKITLPFYFCFLSSSFVLKKNGGKFKTWAMEILLGKRKDPFHPTGETKREYSYHYMYLLWIAHEI